MTDGFLVSAPKSGSGKTITALGLMRAFTRHGLRVAGFKSGPDYIDPAFHAAATRRPSVNLDTWAMPPALIDTLARDAAAGCDLLIGEGAMGLFDGVPAPENRTGASADLAARLGLPVLLVVDVSGQSQTAAAVVKGCDTLRPDIRIAGVILNRVASERHRKLAADAVAAAGYAVVGALPRSDILALLERHLGLVQAEEIAGLDHKLDLLADFMKANVDLNAVRSLALPVRVDPCVRAAMIPPPGQRIALARDAAFSFVYPHFLAGWRAAGAEIFLFSPLANEPPPDDCDACWLPGGYPELHAGRLAMAEGFRDGLRRFVETRPVHGECGGYMVLGESLVDATGTVHRMVGLLTPSFSFAARKMVLGYRTIVLAADCCLGPRGGSFRGHEFHYATMFDAPAPDPPMAAMQDAHNGPASNVGSRRGFATGSFFHLIARASGPSLRE